MHSFVSIKHCMPRSPAICRKWIGSVYLTLVKGCSVSVPLKLMSSFKVIHNVTPGPNNKLFWMSVTSQYRPAEIAVLGTNGGLHKRPVNVRGALPVCWWDISNHQCQPHGGTRRPARRSSKSVIFVIWGPWTPGVKVFQSGPKRFWWWWCCYPYCGPKSFKQFMYFVRIIAVQLYCHKEGKKYWALTVGVQTPAVCTQSQNQLLVLKAKHYSMLLLVCSFRKKNIYCRAQKEAVLYNQHTHESSSTKHGSAADRHIFSDSLWFPGKSQCGVFTCSVVQWLTPLTPHTSNPHTRSK